MQKKIRAKYNVYNSLDKMCGLYEDIVKKKYINKILIKVS